MNQQKAARAEDERTILDLQARLYNAAAQVWQLMQERETLAAELAELRNSKKTAKSRIVK